MTDLSSPTISADEALGGGLAVAEIEDERDIHRRFEDLCRSYGFRGFMVMMMPEEGCLRLADVSLMTNWPAEAVRRFDEAGLLSGSPVVERLRSSTIPFVQETRPDRRGSALTELFGGLRLQRCLYVPVHDTHGQRGAVAFGGDRPVVSATEMWELNLVSGVLFNRLREMLVQRGRRRTGLSRRELECLQWAAAGKTTAEMARIMALSEYTVNHYLNRATRKLDSVNRVQTVAKAIRAGLIV
ncbi:helix-turn-helix transcriptional regulator [Ensifer soli]|uniref:helix-turn-helix transcriptional regulator n=1 Tax=Ciceribacter sp. sgz301302 TaxID=3342379 RepID=UPI0035B87D25